MNEHDRELKQGIDLKGNLMDANHIDILYSMNMHNTVELNTGRSDTLLATKVPGGWIYRFDHDGHSSPIFVPFVPRT